MIATLSRGSEVTMYGEAEDAQGWALLEYSGTFCYASLQYLAERDQDEGQAGSLTAGCTWHDIQKEYSL